MSYKINRVWFWNQTSIEKNQFRRRIFEATELRKCEYRNATTAFYFAAQINYVWKY